MFGSEILDVALGMIFVFLLLSLVASAIREGFESFIKARAVHLERGVRLLLDDPNGDGMARQLYEHPLLSSLFQGEFTPNAKRRLGGHLPTYIPSRTFATALRDLVARGPAVYATAASLSVPQLRLAVATIPSDRVQRALLLAIDSGDNDLTKIQANIEQWFNDTMDRVSGWYRRRTSHGLFAIGAVLAIGMNVDSVAVVNHLWRNRAAREALAARATAFVRDSAAASRILSDTLKSRATLNEQMSELDRLELPIGWRNPSAVPRGAAGWFLKVFGVIVTTFAIALGAPFWFDALKRVMVIRSTVKPVEATGERKGETPQGTATVVAGAALAPPVASHTAPLVAGAPAVSFSNSDPAFEPNRWAGGNAEEGLL
jgi:hypothetical protein